MKFRAWAHGRKAGAIGIFHFIGEVVFESTPEQSSDVAYKEFYKAGYQDVSFLRLKVIEDG